MGVFTDCNQCAECEDEIKDGERVVVTTVSSGTYRANDGDVEYDCYDYQNEIQHEKCYFAQREAEESKL